LNIPKPRCNQISIDATSYYHCVSRCVRRAFLCGYDSFTGQDYEHRRQLLENKILELSAIFALDVCAYAVMSNHYHIVLHINQQQASNWSFDEVISQWHKLFAGSFLSQRYISGHTLSKAELNRLNEYVALWRKQLMDISWFMRVLNEAIARAANKEDNCTGRFWEGRFKSQALLDEAALAACMAYVDLNPIRANIAKTPEESAHTSVKRRIDCSAKKQKTATTPQHYELFPFVGNQRKNMPEGLPFRLQDYLELVDLTGRMIREDKRGFIDNAEPPILKRLNIQAENWLYLTQHFESKLKGLVGSTINLKVACVKLGYRRNYFLKTCEMFFT